MVIETLILNSDLCINHALGDILITDPYTVFGGIQLTVILPFLLFIEYIDMTGFIESEIIEVNRIRLIGNSHHIQQQ